MQWKIKNNQATIHIHDLHSRHSWIKPVVIFINCVLFLRFSHYFWNLWPDVVIEFLESTHHIMSLIAIYLCVHFLKRPRKVIIDFNTGTFRYYYLLFSKKFYFAEVESIRIETDMSKALVKLKGNMCHRVFFKLRKQKSLFIGESYAEEETNHFIDKLKETFNVQIDKLHKIGRKTSKEVNLGRYTIEKEISRGGMGKVFLARDTFARKKVALKVLPANLALKYDHANNFALETRILQRLRHPNIIQVLDVGREKSKKTDIYFYAMECINGKPLSHYIKNQALTTEQSVRYVIQIALALDYIHSHRIVHRDIKPENIMIRDEGSCVLIDFGIARDISIHYKKVYKRVFRHQPEISHYVGTLPYMSPEQIKSGQDIDYRTDIYSLGITLYEMLIFRRVFTGNGAAISRAISSWTPPVPSKENSALPPALDAIVMKAIAKDKNKRYQSGANFAEDLHNWLYNIQVEKTQLSFWEKFWQNIFIFFRGKRL